MDAALAKKLMLYKFPRVLLKNRPEGVAELDGVPWDTAPSGVYDMVFAFVFSLDEMEAAILQADRDGLLREGGFLYLAYPKKGNRAYPGHIHRDSIFPRLGVNEEDGFAAGTALRFTRMVALNDVFTVVGLKREAKGAARGLCPRDPRQGD